MMKNYKSFGTEKNGVPFKEGWTLSRVAAYTKLNCGYWLDQVYDYKEAAQQVKGRTSYWNHQTSKMENQELDQYMWEEWTAKLEESRQYVFETLLEFGLEEGEAHFLSIKFVVSTINKFRLQMFIDFGGQESKQEFQRTGLRNAINHLSTRFERMKVKKTYMWSKEAADETVNEFYTEAAEETARLLVEETGAVIHAKLML